MLRLGRIVLLLAMASVWWCAARAWPELPARIPMHFDLFGQPNGWAAKGVLAWFGLPALATLLGGVFGFALPAAATWLAERRPSWINVLGRQRFKQLPPEGRGRVVAAMMAWLVWLAVALQALMFTIVRGTADVATGRAATMPPLPVFVSLGVTLVLVVGMIVAQVRALGCENLGR